MASPLDALNSPWCFENRSAIGNLPSSLHHAFQRHHISYKLIQAEFMLCKVNREYRGTFDVVLQVPV